MAFKTLTTFALILTLTLLFCTLSTSCTPPKPSPHPPTPGGNCPIDVLKLGVCANVLSGLLHFLIPPKAPCCPLISGLVDLEAAVCLCTAIKLNLLGIHLNIPIGLNLLLNHCGKNVPSGFQCH